MLVPKAWQQSDYSCYTRSTKVAEWYLGTKLVLLLTAKTAVALVRMSQTSQQQWQTDVWCLKLAFSRIWTWLQFWCYIGTSISRFRLDYSFLTWILDLIHVVARYVSEEDPFSQTGISCLFDVLIVVDIVSCFCRYCAENRPTKSNYVQTSLRSFIK